MLSYEVAYFLVIYKTSGVVSCRSESEHTFVYNIEKSILKKYEMLLLHKTIHNVS